MVSKLVLAALLASSALAKTDLGGCVSYETIITVPNRPDVYPYGSLIWYVPDSGEVCEFLDCGGGRAPPKTTVPGCAAYEGSETYSPKFIDPKTLGQAPQTEAADSPSTATDDGVVMTTQQSPETQQTATASAVESENEDDSSSADALSGIPTLTQTGSFPASLLTTMASTTAKTNTAAPERSSSPPNAASSASDGAASNPAPTSSSVSTAAAAGAMPTAGGMLALAAGAAVYAGMI